MATQKFPHTFPMVVIFVLTNYAQLLLYIYYDQSNLYMLVTTKALLVAVTRAQVNANRVQLQTNNSHIAIVATACTLTLYGLSFKAQLCKGVQNLMICIIYNCGLCFCSKFNIKYSAKHQSNILKENYIDYSYVQL